VEIKLNTTIGRDLTLSELKELGYKAIFLAVGAQKDKKLSIPGGSLKGVISGLSFLKDLNFGRKVKVGKRVAVIGGGNTAVDAARCSIRLGAEEVYLIYRRTREEMPSIPEEVEQAEEEGVKILYLTIPVEIIGGNGEVDELRCVSLVLGDRDDSGRRRPLSIPASPFSLKIDTVIVAIGQVPDLSFLRKIDGFQINENGTLGVCPTTYSVGVEGVFAAGDVVTGPATVIEAITAGKKAAMSIDRYLKNESLEKKEGEDEIPISFEEVLRKKEFVEQKKRKKPSFLSLEIRKTTFEEVKKVFTREQIRKTTFEEVKKVFTREQAIEEAKRCLACGCGLGCGICERVCIYSAIERVGDKYKINNEKCDGCGLCVEVCPKENIKMVRT